MMKECPKFALESANFYIKPFQGTHNVLERQHFNKTGNETLESNENQYHLTSSKQHVQEF
uniref:Uncharacterized protein n=1 Tax=Octopus bimaculoides TaxID=37653 RepID=A0A0L8GB57_OCTBM